MLPQKIDTFLKWDDYYVAWPLSVPSQYADWMLVSFEDTQFGGSALIVGRSLSSFEVAHIKQQPMLYWGMKVQNREWALVMWRPGLQVSTGPLPPVYAHDPVRAIGV